MPIPYAFLLAAQGAGMVTDWLGVSNEADLIDAGAQIQQVGIDSAMLQTRLEAEDASVQAMKKLRQTLGSQIAVFAARGTSTAGGSAVGILNESVGNFNSEERTRRINLMSRLNELQAGKTISILQQKGQKSKLWQGFASRTLNRFPTNPEAYTKFFGGE